MPVLAEDIVAYAEYLRSVGFTVTLHGEIASGALFVRFNFHQNPYCQYIKTVLGMGEECVRRQKAVGRKCEGGAFCGSCYAGVCEYVYPVAVRGRVRGFVSLGGYLGGKTAGEKAAHFARKHRIPEEELEKVRRKYLSAAMPERKKADAVLVPLVVLLENYFASQEENAENADPFAAVTAYLSENCHKKITMRQLAEKFHYSLSALSRLFSRKTGKSLPAYLEELRMEEAVFYLRNSPADIAEIAGFLGYSSPNYFSAAFRRHFGVPPKKYRAGKTPE